jgi:hypothetical protein
MNAAAAYLGQTLSFVVSEESPKFAPALGRDPGPPKVDS